MKHSKSKTFEVSLEFLAVYMYYYQNFMSLKVLSKINGLMQKLL
jgi:hypothetical protein